jgi:hypothetical protein
MQVTVNKDADEQACKLVLRACLPANCTQLVTICREQSTACSAAGTCCNDTKQRWACVMDLFA